MSRWSFSLAVALRYLRSAHSSRRASAALSILGIGAGVMTLVAVTGVMNGFQLGFIEDILEVSSYHLQVEGEPLDGETLEHLRVVEGVRAVTAFADGQALMGTETEDLRGVLVRGIDAEAARADPGFADHLEIVAGVFDPETGIVVGAELARALRVTTGDTIRLLALSGTAGGGLDIRWETMPVAGVFRTGYFDFDAGLAFVSMTQVRAVFGDPPTVYGLKIRDPFADLAAAVRVERRLAVADPGSTRTVTTWRSFNPAFFSALRLEKVLMFVLPGLIFVVVAFSIYHSLRRSVFERREEIALLGALGASPLVVRAIYLLEGAVIGLAGALPGLAAGLAVAANIGRIFHGVERLVNGVLGLAEIVAGPLIGGAEGSFSIFSPTFFYLTEVSARVPLAEAMGITIAGVVCAALSALLASARITRLDPAMVLRHE